MIILNKVGKAAMWMAGVGTASYLSYKYLLPKDKKEKVKDIASNMISNMNNNQNGNGRSMN